MEDLDLDELREGFDLVINAESLQYIDLDVACCMVPALLKDSGSWLVLDYFRLQDSTRNRSGHLLKSFEDTIRRHAFQVRDRVDITENVLPTLAYAHTLASRIALPLVEFAAERFLAKHPLWNYFVGDTARAKLARITLDGLDPAVFRRDKRYMLFELAKPG